MHCPSPRARLIQEVLEIQKAKSSNTSIIRFEFIITAEHCIVLQHPNQVEGFWPHPQTP